MINKEKHPCEGETFDGWRSHPCQRNGGVERDGHFYCKSHDPVTIKEKQEKKEAQWHKEWEEEKELHNRRNILLQMAEGIPTNELNKYHLILKAEY